MYVGTCYGQGFVVMAHNYNSHFGPIKDLQLGDEVVFQNLANNRFHYVVDDAEELEPTAIEEMIDSGYDLTLFTCTRGGGARVTIRCTLTEAEHLTTHD